MVQNKNINYQNPFVGKRTINEIELVECYTAYLKERGVRFYSNGFPKFESKWFITDPPLVIAPFNKRKYYSQNKRDISICYFEKDEDLYPRFSKVFKEINILREYHSVCMMDISISPLMLDEVQRMNLLLNLLFTAVIAVNGIKIMPSFRTGNFETLNLLVASVGISKYWVMGSVGTQQIRSNLFYEYLFRAKCLFIMPKTLLSYGRPNNSTTGCLNEYGIECLQYKDFRALSYSKEVRYG